MRNELTSAANFLVHLVRLHRLPPYVNEQQLKTFRDCLIEVFYRRYRDHWCLKKPYKWAGYRTIRINQYKIEPMIIQAAEACNFPVELIRAAIHYNFILWIDPYEVSYRIGAKEIGILYNGPGTLIWCPPLSSISPSVKRQQKHNVFVHK